MTIIPSGLKFHFLNAPFLVSGILLARDWEAKKSTKLNFETVTLRSSPVLSRAACNHVWSKHMYLTFLNHFIV